MLKNKTKLNVLGLFMAAVMGSSCLFSGMESVFTAKADGTAVDNSVQIGNLEVNGSEQPLGIDDRTPVFSWQLSSQAWDKVQSAYQIVVKDGGTTVWDSGKVESENNYGVLYGGTQALKSKTLYDWTVSVWDGDGEACATGKSTFETGIMSQSDWNSEWIGEPSLQSEMNFSGANWIWDRQGRAENEIPAETLYFRRSVKVDPSKKIDRIQIAMSADDSAVLYVNGREVLSTPDVADAWESATVATLSASALGSGENVFAVEASNTSNGYAGFLAKIEIYYTNASTQTIVTDGEWRISRTAEQGWEQTDFDDSGYASLSGNDIIPYGSNPWGDRVSFAGSDRTAPLFRTQFETESGKSIKYARAYIAGLGLFDLKINGANPDDSVLNPANTDYDDTVLYNVFDVTHLINNGSNAICVELGNGFYNEAMGGWNWSDATWRDTPRMRFELDITYLDGTVQHVKSDSGWKFSKEGPTAENSIYCGETFDARKDGQFSSVNYDDSLWQYASVVSAPKGSLVWQDMEPMRKTQAFGKDEGVTVAYNAGILKYTVKTPRMITGWGKIVFRNTTAGQKIVIDYGETLATDGNLNKKEQDGIFQRDVYICRGVSGDETEVYEPKFNYKGFEYIQIEGYKGELTADDVTCYLIHNDVAVTAQFASSNGLLNELHTLMVNTLLNNFQGKPTDTPWLEKNGWLGDVNMAIGSMGYDFDIARFMAKFLNDIADSQEQSGNIPQLVPISNWGTTNAPVWNSVFIFAVRELCDTYGMGWLVSKYYDGMKKLADLDIEALRGRQWIWGEETVLGDWVSPMGNENAEYDENPPEGGSLAATAYVYAMLGVMAEYAESLGKTQDISVFNSARASILSAFNAKFLKGDIYDTGWWASGHAYNRTEYRQTSNILPLVFGMVPEEKTDAVVENLVNDVIGKDYHLDTGVIGTKYILPLLCDYGYEDVAYRILTQVTYPSWGYFIESGATSLWEMWESTARSHNHYFLGTYDEWFFSYLAGIKDVKDGYREFTLDPLLAGDLTQVDVTLSTVRGTLGVKWELCGDDTAQFDVQIPFGSTAKLYLPTKSADGVLLDGSALTAGNGVKNIAVVNGRLELTLGSGSYCFTSPLDMRKIYTGSLEQAISSAEKLSEADYRAEGWTRFQTVLNEVKEVQSGTQSQVLINSAVSKLTSAIADLREFTNEYRVALKARVSEILSSGIMDLSYPAGAVTVFQQALSKASVASRNTALTEDDMRAELETFEKAILALMSQCRSNFARVGTATLTASSSVSAVNDGWGLSYLTDGYTGSSGGWSSANLLTEQHEEWVQIDLGYAYMFDKVVIYTSAGGGSGLAYGMPADFVIETSQDGVNYTAVLTQTGYPVAECGKHEFTFNAVTARYVRLRGTRLNRLPNDGNTYRMQIAEMEIYNSPRADLSALTALIERYDGLDRSLYTTDSLIQLEDVIAKALNLVNGVVYESSQQEVDVVAEELENALDGLVLKSPAVNPPAENPPTDETPADSGGPDVGAIVGGVIGGIAGVAVICAVVIILLKRKNKRK